MKLSALGLVLSLLLCLNTVVSAETPWKMQAISPDHSVVITLFNTPCLNTKIGSLLSPEIIEKLTAGTVVVNGVQMAACWSALKEGGIAIIAEDGQVGELDPDLFHKVDDV